MENPRHDLIEHEAACARVAAHFSPHWLRCYVRGKLRHDPIFSIAYDRLHGSNHPILDVGCGVGLLAFYLRERGCRQPVVGLDLDARKIRHAAAVGAAHYQDVFFRGQDVRDALPDFSGNITVFDLLHYLPTTAQSVLLLQLAESVPPDGSVLIRDCPRDGNWRFWLTCLAEKFAQAISWNLSAPLHFPPRSILEEAFPEGDFARQIQPLWGRTLFNNYLFTFRRRPQRSSGSGIMH
jgi:2-polyprenyl-3-methyl-5-hydroxy-6-metoxy-1,4-benzoquinol methylase